MALEADILNAITDLVGRYGLRDSQVADLLGGSPDGGPNGDGRYPVTYPDGETRLVPCIALQVGGGSLDAAGVASLGALPAAQNTAATRFLAVGANGQPYRTTSAQIMQRVVDYQQMDEIIGDELLPALTSSGLPRKIAIGELIKKFSGGIIDVTAPPYNVVPDGRLYQDGCTILIGSNVLSANDDVFSATDVGKPIRVFSAAADTGGALETTIIEFVNSRQVKLGKVASTNAINRHACWGTINTVGMRRAMADAASPDVARRGGVVLLPPGSIITASLPFGNGAAIKGWGRKTSRFIHWHEVNEPRAFLYNDDQTVTYAGVPYAAADQVMMDFGINGNRWLYVPGQGGDADGYSHFIAAGRPEGDTTTVLRTIGGDPLHYYSGIVTENCGRNGFSIMGRHSGTIMALDSESNGYFGIQNGAFDVNMSSILCIANWGPGYMSGNMNAVYAPESNIQASAGCNINNLKVSFNGTGSWGGADDAWANVMSANFVECGGANVYTALRVQESMGHNILLWMQANGNKFQVPVADDTADQFWPKLSNIDSMDNRETVALSFRASRALMGPRVRNNKIYDATAGQAVRVQDFATHSVAITPGPVPWNETAVPHNNLIRFERTEPDDAKAYRTLSQYAGDFRRAGPTLEIPGSGAFAANRVSIDGVPKT